MESVYYIREKSLNFYDQRGRLTGGIIGNLAKEKFRRLRKAGLRPRISFAKEVEADIKSVRTFRIF